MRQELWLCTIGLQAHGSALLATCQSMQLSRRCLTSERPAAHAQHPAHAALQDTLTQLLYKGGRFQFSRLESLLAQAARAPGRSILAQERDGNAAPGSALEARRNCLRPCCSQ